MGVDLEDLGGGLGDPRLVCTLAQFKERYGIEGLGDDAAILALLDGVSAQIAGACGRFSGGEPALHALEREQIFSVEPGLRHLYLPAWPIAAVDEAIEAPEGAFDDADPLVKDTDFTVKAASGCLCRVGAAWLWGEMAVFVSWTGGYTSPDVAVAGDYDAWAASTPYVVGDRAQSGFGYWRCIEAHTSGSTFDQAKWIQEFLMPSDLVEAALEQAGYAWQRRATQGMSGASAGQGGSFSDSAGDDLLKGVEAVCQRYRRLM